MHDAPQRAPHGLKRKPSLVLDRAAHAGTMLTNANANANANEAAPMPRSALSTLQPGQAVEVACIWADRVGAVEVRSNVLVECVERDRHLLIH